MRYEIDGQDVGVSTPIDEVSGGETAVLITAKQQKGGGGMLADVVHTPVSHDKIAVLCGDHEEAARARDWGRVCSGSISFEER